MADDYLSDEHITDGKHTREMSLGKKDYTEKTEMKMGADGVEEMHVSYDLLPKPSRRPTKTFMKNPKTGKMEWITHENFTDSNK